MYPVCTAQAPNKQLQRTVIHLSARHMRSMPPLNCGVSSCGPSWRNFYQLAPVSVDLPQVFPQFGEIVIAFCRLTALAPLGIDPLNRRVEGEPAAGTSAVRLQSPVI